MRTAAAAAAALCALLVAAVCCADAQRVLGAELLANPSFETADGGGGAASWAQFTGGNASLVGYAVAAGEGVGGGAAARVDAARPDETHAASQAVALVPDRPFVVSAWAKTPAGVVLNTGASPVFGLYLDVFLQTGTPLYGQLVQFAPAASATYAQQERVFCPPLGNAFVSANVYAMLRDATGTAYFDALSLRTIESQGANASRSLVNATSSSVAAGAATLIGTVSVFLRDGTGAPIACVGDAFEVRVVYPNGTSRVAAQTFVGAGRYMLSGIDSSTAGAYALHASINGSAMLGSPLAFAVSAGAPSAAASELAANSTVQELGSGSAPAIDVLLRDALGNVVPAADTSALVLSDSVRFAVSVVNASLGRVRVALNTTASGTYCVNVTIGGALLRGRCLAFVLLPGAASLAHYVLQLPSELLPNRTNVLVLRAADAFGNVLVLPQGSAVSVLASVAAVAAASGNASVPPVDVSIANDGNGTYRIWLATPAEVNVTLNLSTGTGELVGGALHALFVRVGSAVGAATALSVAPTSLVAGQNASVVAVFYDAAGNRASAATARCIVDTSSSALLAQTVSSDPRELRCVVGARLAGAHALAVRLGATDVASDVLTVTAGPPRADAYRCELRGVASIEGLRQYAFVVTADDGYGNVPAGVLTPPAATALGVSTVISVGSLGAGNYSVNVRAGALGQLSIAVTLASVPIAGSPFELSVVAGPPVSAGFVEPVVSEPTVGLASSLSFNLVDSYGFPLTAAQGQVAAAIAPSGSATVSDGPLGSVAVAYSAPTAGVYSLTVTYGSPPVHVTGSPFALRFYTASPSIVSFVASDASGDGNYGAGDTLTVRFDMQTNRPALATHADIVDMFLFSETPAAQLSATWISSRTTGGQDSLILTVMAAASSAPTSAARVSVRGYLVDSANTSKPSRAQSPSMSGSFTQSSCPPFGYVGGLCWWLWIVIGVAAIVVAVLVCVVCCCVCSLHSPLRSGDSVARKAEAELVGHGGVRRSVSGARGRPESTSSQQHLVGPGPARGASVASGRGRDSVASNSAFTPVRHGDRDEQGARSPALAASTSGMRGRSPAGAAPRSAAALHSSPLSAASARSGGTGQRSASHTPAAYAADAPGAPMAGDGADDAITREMLQQVLQQLGKYGSLDEALAILQSAAGQRSASRASNVSAQSDASVDVPPLPPPHGHAHAAPQHSPRDRPSDGGKSAPLFKRHGSGLSAAIRPPRAPRGRSGSPAAGYVSPRSPSPVLSDSAMNASLSSIAPRLTITPPPEAMSPGETLAASDLQIFVAGDGDERAGSAASSGYSTPSPRIVVSAASSSGLGGHGGRSAHAIAVPGAAVAEPRTASRSSERNDTDDIRLGAPVGQRDQWSFHSNVSVKSSSLESTGDPVFMDRSRAGSLASSSGAGRGGGGGGGDDADDGVDPLRRL